MREWRRGDSTVGWWWTSPAESRLRPAVARIKSLVGRGAKVGHAGTLDPMATGVLPVAIGEATKTVSFMMDAPKRYRFGVRWGEQRDTDDAEGAVVETSEAGRAKPRSQPLFPASSAASSRCHRRSQPSRSAASAPTRWRGGGGRRSSRRAPST